MTAATPSTCCGPTHRLARARGRSRPTDARAHGPAARRVRVAIPDPSRQLQRARRGTAPRSRVRVPTASCSTSASRRARWTIPRAGSAFARAVRSTCACTRARARRRPTWSRPSTSARSPTFSGATGKSRPRAASPAPSSPIGRRSPFTTTTALADLIERIVRRRGGTHPATRVFQALRIAVNRELEHLGTFLARVLEWLLPAGRLVIIAYHSLEDRMVKQAMRSWVRALHLPAGAAAVRVRRGGAGADPHQEGGRAEPRRRSRPIGGRARRICGPWRCWRDHGHERTSPMNVAVVWGRSLQQVGRSGTATRSRPCGRGRARASGDSRSRSRSAR